MQQHDIGRISKYYLLCEPRRFEEDACPECRLAYEPSSINDRANHDRQHNAVVNGQPIAKPSEDRLLARANEFEVFIADQRCGPQEAKAIAIVASIAGSIDEQCGVAPFAAANIKNGSVSVIWARDSRGRIAGMLVLDQNIDEAWRVRLEQFRLVCENQRSSVNVRCETIPGLAGVGFLSELQKYRNRGLRQLLLDLAIQLRGGWEFLAFQRPFTTESCRFVCCSAMAANRETVLIYS